ncbi:MAG TPA: RNA methyltransferase [Polyangiaceae bacterium]|nr:RNA methyltransferase [Polyangiaceae bacterium]
MPIIEVEDAADPRLASYALVADPSGLQRSGRFIAEGRLVVERLLALPDYEIESLLLSASALRALAAQIDANARRFPVYVCPAPLFERLTGHEFHRGCLGLVRRPAPLDPELLISHARLLVVLEAVANADNVGGVFRNAAAFGADAVLLDPACSDPLYRKAIRTSMGASLSVPFVRIGAEGPPKCESTPGVPKRTLPELLSVLRERGFEVLALTPQPPSCDLDTWAASASPSARRALLLGAEGAGLSADVLARATLRLRIAMRPGIDSLNLSVACGIALQRLHALESLRGS